MGNWKKKEKENLKKSKKANIKQIKEGKGFPTFTEYMTANGKVVQDDVPIETVPDYKGPHKASPEKSGDYPYEAFSGKKTKKAVGTPGAYQAPGHAWSLEQTLRPKGEKSDGGFAKEGPKDLVYNPDTKPGLTQPKTKMEQFLAATRDMSTPEYTKFMAERTSRGGVEYEAIRYIASNPIALRDLVREVRRSEQLNVLIESLLALPESYDVIVEAMAENSSYRAKLAKSFDDQLIEMIGPPFHKLDDEDEDIPTGEEDEDEEFDDESEDEEDEDELSDEEDEFDDEDDEDEDEDEDEEFDDDDEENEPPMDDNITGGERGPDLPPDITSKIRAMMNRR